MKKIKLRFSKAYIEFYKGRKLSFKNAEHIWIRKYGVTRGYRAAISLARMFELIDEQNQPLPPYDAMNLFDVYQQKIHYPDGDYIRKHNQLLLTLKGLVFIGRFLQQHKDVKLKRVKKEKTDFPDIEPFWY